MPISVPSSQSDVFRTNKKNNFQIVTALYIRLLPKIKQVIVYIFNNEILIQGYMEKIHSAGDSVIVLHAFEIPSLPYSSGPCEYTQMLHFCLL